MAIPNHRQIRLIGITTQLKATLIPTLVQMELGQEIIPQKLVIMVVVDQSIQAHKVVNTILMTMEKRSMSLNNKFLRSKVLSCLIGFFLALNVFALDTQSYARDFLNEMIDKENGIKNIIEEELSDRRDLQKKGLNKLLEIKVRCNLSTNMNSKLSEESLQILRSLVRQISDIDEFIQIEERRIANKLENSKQVRARYCPSPDGDLAQYMRCVQKDTIWRIVIKREYEVKVNNLLLKQLAETTEDIKNCAIDKKTISSYDLQVTSELLEAYRSYIANVDRRINDGLAKIIY